MVLEGITLMYEWSTIDLINYHNEIIPKEMFRNIFFAIA